MKKKLASRQGINRAVALVLALVLVLAVLISIPIYLSYKKRADQFSCTVALKKAQDMLDVEFLWNYELSHDEALKVVERAKWEMEALCPAGGDYYLVDRPESDQVYRVTCGIHEKNTYLRTRLNAAHVLELLEDALANCVRRGIEVPEEGFTFLVNSRELPVPLLEEPVDLRWGTSASIDYEGIVSFFTLAEDGSVAWFVYADENHASVYRAGNDWGGDAWAE
ncbi:MAG: hypothetical protein IKO91_02075 [Oscillospiraceae bacterium]|nr:hypothetical protein [Oscillospiraceae bacterium]